MEEYYTKLMDKYPDGKMDIPDFIGEYFNCSYSKLFFTVMEDGLPFIQFFLAEMLNCKLYYQHELLAF